MIRSEAYRDARLIVIASEGDETEPRYFTALAREYDSPRTHVKILKRQEGEKNNSSPSHVLQQLNDLKKEYALEADDELWLVIDRDKWTEEIVSRVAQECSQDPMMRLALSNPCFELWLVLHFVDVAALPDEEKLRFQENKKRTKSSDPYLKKYLRKLMYSYHEARYNTSLLMPHVATAIKHAKAIDLTPADRWPQTLGTRVYRLAESIIGKRT